MFSLLDGLRWTGLKITFTSVPFDLQSWFVAVFQRHSALGAGTENDHISGSHFVTG